MKTIRPLKDGVIADFHAAEHMIRGFDQDDQFWPANYLQPSLRMVICIPSGITEVEKRAVRDSCRACGCQRGVFDIRTDGRSNWYWD